MVNWLILDPNLTINHPPYVRKVWYWSWSKINKWGHLLLPYLLSLLFSLDWVGVESTCYILYAFIWFLGPILGVNIWWETNFYRYILFWCYKERIICTCSPCWHISHFYSSDYQNIYICFSFSIPIMTSSNADFNILQFQVLFYLGYLL